MKMEQRFVMTTICWVLSLKQLL